MKPLLLKHLAGEPIGHFPVWLMRQAGRYLPRYRQIREKHTFWEMATKPEVAAEVTLLPLEVIPVDGVILFQDILTLPYGLGLNIEMRESVGPVTVEPLRTRAAFEVFEKFSPQTHTAFVGEALRRVAAAVPKETAVLGFAGAPWTVACYLIEGKPGKNFETLLRWMHRDPADFAAALAPLADATARYLVHQSRNGAHVVQLFDTWASEMPRSFFVTHYRPLLDRIFRVLRDERIPTIYFPRHAHHLLGDLASLDVDVISCDALLRLPEFEARIGKKFSLQGNLDPRILFADEGTVRREARLLVKDARELSRPAILNLGHGILPQTPVENVKAFVEEARTLWI